MTRRVDPPIEEYTRRRLSEPSVVEASAPSPRLRGESRGEGRDDWPLAARPLIRPFGPRSPRQRPPAGRRDAYLGSRSPRLLDERREQRVESLRRLPLRRMARAGNRLHGPAPQRRHGERSEIGAIDELLFGAVQHGERRLEIADDNDLVGISARPEARGDAGAR